MAILFQALPFSMQGLLQTFQNLGFFQLLFPFLLSLAIIYGVLSAVAGKGEKAWLPKSARGLIAIIISFFAMLFAAQNPSLVDFYTFLGGTGIIIASVILILIILLGMLGLRFEDLWDKSKTGARHWVGVLAIVVIILVFFFGVLGSTTFGLPSWITSNDLWSIIVFIIILALVFWWLGKEDSEPKEKK